MSAVLTGSTYMPQQMPASRCCASLNCSFCSAVSFSRGTQSSLMRVMCVGAVTSSDGCPLDESVSLVALAVASPVAASPVAASSVIRPPVLSGIFVPIAVASISASSMDVLSGTVTTSAPDSSVYAPAARQDHSPLASRLQSQPAWTGLAAAASIRPRPVSVWRGPQEGERKNSFMWFIPLKGFGSKSLAL